VFGNPRAEATHWGIEGAIGGGKWRKLRVSNGDGVAEGEWPIDTLSLDVVRERWGAGEYRTRWFAFSGDVPTNAGTGRVFVVEQVREEDPAPAHVAAAAPALPDGLGPAIALMNFADQRSAQSLRSIVEVAGVLANNRGGADMQMLQMLMAQQQQNFQATLEAQRLASEQQFAMMRHELGALRANLEDDGDDRDSAIEGVARAAAPLFKAGKPMSEGIKAALANWVVSNPKDVIDLIKSVPAVLAAVSQATQQQQATAPTEPAPAPPQLVRVRPVAKVAPPPPPQQPGLNELLSRKPAEEPAAE